MYRNLELSVNKQRLAEWNIAERRRKSFRNLQYINRRSLCFRAPTILNLFKTSENNIDSINLLKQLEKTSSFCAVVIAKNNQILYESHASDFATDQLHSIQSITKTLAHLALGRLIVGGRVDPECAVGEYVPEAGDAYAKVSIQQVLDMDVGTNFAENYIAPYTPCPVRGDPVGYARQEIAMGWRLPPDGENEFGVRDFVAWLVEKPRIPNGVTLYTSPNTDLLGWIIERASGRLLASHIEDIVTDAGIEATFHISTDCMGVPVISGGGVMTARDLVRYGLLIARQNSDFLRDTMSGAGTIYSSSPSRRYRNHLLTNGTWVGHPGYAGQFLMIDPFNQAAAAFFSVLETEDGAKDGYFDEIIMALEQALEQLR